MRFLTSLKNQKAAGRIPVIPDIKCFSPKDGDLLRGRDPLRIAEALAASGACVLSVVTEEREFHGSLELLRKICLRTGLPVLRKDFIETADDLKKTKEAGAEAVLLMYSCLERETLEDLYYKALDMGLQPFVETHTAQELAWASALGAELIGINNRDILNLERDDGDVSYAAGLLEKRPKQAFLVVESGLKDGRDVRAAIRAGADGVLTGTAILRAEDPSRMYRSMIRPCGLKICGITDRDGIDLCLKQHVDILGFVTEYPVPVPWNLTAEQTADLLAYVYSLSGEPDDGIMPASAQTCLVTGGTPEKVTTLAEALRPDMVQLHYAETLEETSRIAETLHEKGILVIRSIPSDRSLRGIMFGTEDLGQITERLERTAVAALLLDTRDAGNAANGGGSILEDPEAAALLSGRNGCSKPVFLGGGLTADNIRETILRCAPDAADIMTGIEILPGRKSPEKLEKLVRNMTLMNEQLHLNER